MATESTTLRAAARLVSLGAFVAATHLLDQPKIREAARRLDQKIDRFQGVAEYKAERVKKNAKRNKVYVVAGLAALTVAGALITRASMK
jgi:hypothetical protein